MELDESRTYSNDKVVKIRANTMATPHVKMKKLGTKRSTKKDLNLSVANLKSVATPKNFSFLNSSVQKQTLRANNRALARDLARARQNLRQANREIQEQTSKNQELSLELTRLRRVAGIRDDEINAEVTKRMQGYVLEMRTLLEELTQNMLQSSGCVTKLHDKCLDFCRRDSAGSRSTSLSGVFVNQSSSHQQLFSHSTNTLLNKFLSSADEVAITTDGGGGSDSGPSDMTMIAEQSMVIENIQEAVDELDQPFTAVSLSTVSETGDANVRRERSRLSDFQLPQRVLVSDCKQPETGKSDQACVVSDVNPFKPTRTLLRSPPDHVQAKPSKPSSEGKSKPSLEINDTVNEEDITVDQQTFLAKVRESLEAATVPTEFVTKRKSVKNDAPVEKISISPEQSCSLERKVVTKRKSVKHNVPVEKANISPEKSCSLERKVVTKRKSVKNDAPVEITNISPEKSCSLERKVVTKRKSVKNDAAVEKTSISPEKSCSLERNVCTKKKSRTKQDKNSANHKQDQPIENKEVAKKKSKTEIGNNAHVDEIDDAKIENDAPVDEIDVSKENSTSGKEQEPVIGKAEDPGSLPKMCTLKPGVFTYKVSRKELDGSRKPVPDKVKMTRSKKKKKVISPEKEEPKLGEDRDLFNFGDRTPTVPLDKLTKVAGTFDLSMNESVVGPRIGFNNFHQRMSTDGSGTAQMEFNEVEKDVHKSTAKTVRGGTNKAKKSTGRTLTGKKRKVEADNQTLSQTEGKVSNKETGKKRKAETDNQTPSNTDGKVSNKENKQPSHLETLKRKLALVPSSDMRDRNARKTLSSKAGEDTHSERSSRGVIPADGADSERSDRDVIPADREKSTSGVVSADGVDSERSKKCNARKTLSSKAGEDTHSERSSRDVIPADREKSTCGVVSADGVDSERSKKCNARKTPSSKAGEDTHSERSSLVVVPVDGADSKRSSGVMPADSEDNPRRRRNVASVSYKEQSCNKKMRREDVQGSKSMSKGKAEKARLLIAGKMGKL